jgi:tellurite resistance protein TerC
VCAAINLPRGSEHDEADNAVVRFARRHLSTTDKWDGLKLYVKKDSNRLMTPMFLVIMALVSRAVN